MAMSTRERVDTLENALKELAYAGRRTEMSLEQFHAEAHERDLRMDEVLRQTQASVNRLSTEMVDFKREMADFKDEMREFKNEMSDFKGEMSDFKDEMSVFKDEMGVFKDEMGVFKDEMREFKNEMSDFKDETRIDREKSSRELREMKAQWGALANKMGTFVEDMVVPNFPHILERYFGIAEVDDMLVGRRKRHPKDRDRIKEFDLLAWTVDTLFWSETKSKATVERFREFIEDESVFEYFPELAGRRLVKIGSALSIPGDVVAYLTRQGCYAMMLGEETMDIVNFSEVAGEPPRGND